MKIAMIAAMDQNRVIGKDNAMPWHLPDDLKFFKAVTTGKTVIMGRKTFESIGCRPLPNRRNIVISRNPSFVAEGAEVYRCIELALEGCETEAGTETEVMIMGGGQLYRQMLPRADKLYLTLVETRLEGDTCFPDWTGLRWQELDRQHHPSDEKHPFAFDFVTLERLEDDTLS